MLINHSIKNFSGGVSQQPDADRFDNQMESMDNFMITMANGTRRRNPIETVISVGAVTSNIATHSYDRGDGKEKYIIMLDSTGIRIADIAGAPVYMEPVTNILYAGSSVMDYWGPIDYEKDIQFLTVGDVTWILNKKKFVTARQDAETTYGDVPKAFYWLKRSFNDGADGGYTYEVICDGVSFSTNNIDSIAAATSLVTAINAHASFTAKSIGSTVRIQRTDNGTFTFSWGDSWGNQASIGWYSFYGAYSGVEKLEDLPASLSGFTEAEVGVLPITGTDRNNFTNYYLKWKDNRWTETFKYGHNTFLDYATMPAKLVRQSDDSFVFGFNTAVGGSAYELFDTEWGNRRRGDSETSPLPSFVGNTISNMFFFKNRLGFTSGENVILSEIGRYYNFFATTVLEVLDSDPIDAAVDSNTVSILRHINTTAGALTLWADNAQFILSGGDILSPATTKIAQTSSYSSSNRLVPKVIDNNIIFFNEVGSYLDVLSFDPASIQNDKSTAEDIAAHIPNYLPATIKTTASSSAHNMLFLLGATNDKKIYVYKYHVRGGEKVVSAWFEWTFTIAIKAISVLDEILYLISSDGNIYQLLLEPKDITGTFLDSDTGAPFTSSIVMSRYNVELANHSRAIRQPFYIKNLKINKSGELDLDIINSERTSSILVKNKHLGRRLFIGGNSEKINIGFSTSYATGCQLDTVSIEGRFNTTSKNI